MKWTLVSLVGVWVLGILLLAVIVLLGGSFGDPLLDVLLVNDSDEPVRYFWQYSGTEAFQGNVIAPLSSQRGNVMIVGPTLRILARRDDGTVVFDETWPWEDLTRKAERPVVITVAQGQPP